MKSYTDLEQSERLAKILPLESADMALCSKVQPLMTDYISAKKKFSNAGEIPIDPCWSLVALLDVLKDDIKIEKTLFDQSDMFTYSILGDAYVYRTYEHEDLIDALDDAIKICSKEEFILPKESILLTIPVALIFISFSYI